MRILLPPFTRASPTTTPVGPVRTGTGMILVPIPATPVAIPVYPIGTYDAEASFVVLKELSKTVYFGS